MYGCESWTVRKAEHQRTDAFELWCWRRLMRVPRRSNQSILKEISPGCSLEGHAKAEAPILWSPDAKNWFIGKNPNAGKDWRQEEKGTTEDEMVGWYHWLNGHEFEWTLGVGNGQGGLGAAVHGVAESDTTERLNWTEKDVVYKIWHDYIRRHFHVKSFFQLRQRGERNHLWP